MKKLKDCIAEAGQKGVAIGHFNISDLAGLKGIFEAAQEVSKSQNLEMPIIIGVSDGERKFIGLKNIVDLVKNLQEEFNYPIFLNADHVKNINDVKEIAEAGFDSIMFDAGSLPFEQNVAMTKKAVEIIKSVNPEILAEGEIGYLGVGSEVIKEISENVITEENMTKPEQAAIFVKETGIDLLAPAVGNIHGIVVTQTMTKNPPLDIPRLKNIKTAVNIPLVLHGGSGISDEDFKAAIKAGVSIIHINTEIRLAWRNDLEKAFKENPQEIAPYKLLVESVEEIKLVVEKKLKLFNNLS